MADPPEIPARTPRVLLRPRVHAAPGVDALPLDAYIADFLATPSSAACSATCSSDPCSPQSVLRGALVEHTDFYLVDLRGAKYTEEQGRHFANCGAILHSRTAR